MHLHCCRLLACLACASGFLSNRLATLPAVSKKMLGILFPHKQFYHLNRTVVLQIWQKKTIKMTCMSFLCIITLRNKTAAHNYLPSTKQMAVSVKKYLGL